MTMVETASGVITEEQAASLRPRIRGEVVTPGEPSYDAVRKVWNGMIDKRPGAIARCVTAADVMTAVRFAREHDLLVSVRGGGHNVGGNALCDGGLTIDLSLMRGVRVDPEARTVRVAGGALLGDVDQETQEFGLVVPAGIVSHTGVAGLTLGGGIGWLARRFGLTADNLLSVDLVTAEGERVTASEDENADLLWGVRGGGGNFGIVTSFEFRAHPMQRTVLAGLLGWEIEQGGELLRFYRDLVAQAPDELGTVVGLRLAPPAPFVPPALHGKPVAAIFVCHSGSLDEAERALRPLREFGAPAIDTVQPMPYTSFQQMLDPMQPHGRRYYMKAHDLPGLSDDAIEAMVAAVPTITSPHTIIAMFHLGGAIGNVAEDATAYSHRAAEFALNINASWEAPDDARHIEWARALSAKMEPHAMGVYVNFLGEEGDERVRAAYGAEKYERLAALKAKYDPTNFFRLNQNIRPAGA
jgi:FAD/FMN-containing dehydrogenase